MTSWLLSAKLSPEQVPCPSLLITCNNGQHQERDTKQKGQEKTIGRTLCSNSAKTYNTRDSLVVTDLTTDLALTSLSRGERTGSRILLWIWSYVLSSGVDRVYEEEQLKWPNPGGVNTLARVAGIISAGRSQALRELSSRRLGNTRHGRDWKQTGIDTS